MAGAAGEAVVPPAKPVSAPGPTLPAASRYAEELCRGVSGREEAIRIGSVGIDETSFRHRRTDCAHATPVSHDLACQIARSVGLDQRFDHRVFIYLPFHQVHRAQYDTNTRAGRAVVYLHARGDLFVGDPRGGSRRYCIEPRGRDVTLRLYSQYG